MWRKVMDKDCNIILKKCLDTARLYIVIYKPKNVFKVQKIFFNGTIVTRIKFSPMSPPSMKKKCNLSSCARHYYQKSFAGDNKLVSPACVFVCCLCLFVCIAHVCAGKIKKCAKIKKLYIQ